MMRDIPRVYTMIALFVGLMAFLFTTYVMAFQRDTDMLTLNEAVMSAAVAEVDQSSRLYEGVLLLSRGFEADVLKRLAADYPADAEVQLDYRFDETDGRFTGVPASSSSGVYTLGGAASSNTTHYVDRPVKAVRVKLRMPDDTVTDWTYVSTVTVDALSR